MNKLVLLAALACASPRPGPPTPFPGLNENATMQVLSYGAPPAAAPVAAPRFDPARFDLPVEVNPAVLAWLSYFRGPGAGLLARWQQRGAPLRSEIETKLAALGLPRDLYYVAMI